jgi:1-acyl-sn-glycerol-3-phosphate acyltransferase
LRSRSLDADERDRRGEFRPWFYRLVRIVATPVFYGVFRLRVSGVENVPSAGGVVVSSQHRSNFDPFLIGLSLRRHLRFMAKAEMYRIAPVAWVVRSGGAFKIERGQQDTAAVDMAIDLVREGWAVAIYPEGTRNKKGAGPPRPRSGAARVALAANAPMVPVAIRGVDRIRLFPPRIPRFECRFGAPLTTEGLAELEPQQAARLLTERWVEAVAALQAEMSAR